jgi:hypothetical protein
MRSVIYAERHYSGWYYDDCVIALGMVTSSILHGAQISLLHCSPEPGCAKPTFFSSF